MNKKLNIAIGHEFGSLTIVEPIGIVRGRMKYRCRCTCGSIIEAVGTELMRGRTTRCQPCGLTSAGEKNVKHRMCNSPEYRSWSAMKSRCSNQNNVAYSKYGGSGISVCQRWIDSFEAFYADMGTRHVGTTLDRWPDPSGNYEPENCRWATPKQQSNNRTINRRLTIDGVTRTCGEWADVYGRKDIHVIYRRLDAGWSHRDAVMAEEGSIRAKRPNDKEICAKASAVRIAKLKEKKFMSFQTGDIRPAELER